MTNSDEMSVAEAGERFENYLGEFMEQEKSLLSVAGDSALHERLAHFFDRLLDKVEHSPFYEREHISSEKRFGWSHKIEDAGDIYYSPHSMSH